MTERERNLYITVVKLYKRVQALESRIGVSTLPELEAQDLIVDTSCDLDKIIEIFDKIK